jgi:hypothetical protein
MSRHLRKNDDTHMAYGRQVMRYLKRTRTTGLTLRASSDLQLRCWVDSSYAEDPNTRFSIIITLGSSAVFSKVFLQPTVAVSSCEAELNGFFEAALWLEFFRRIAVFMGITPARPYHRIRGQCVCYRGAQEARPIGPLKTLRRALLSHQRVHRPRRDRGTVAL